MAGHSKWANIKHRKARQDAKRGKIFTRLIREITVAARSGADPAENSRLRLAVMRARTENMGNEAINRAITRGSGGEDGEAMIEASYEGYGPGGVAVIVEAMTDNKKRTVAEVRHQFARAGGNLGTDGSVAYLFKRRALICFAADTDSEQLFEVALENGAEDILSLDDQSQEVIVEIEQLNILLEACKAVGLPDPINVEITMLPNTMIALDLSTAEKALRLIDALEDLDDVQNVYINGEIPESVSLDKN